MGTLIRRRSSGVKTCSSGKKELGGSHLINGSFRRSGLQPRRKGITEHGLSRFLRPPAFWRKPLKNASRRLALHLLNGFQLEGFSVERLMNFLTALDRDVDIVIRRRPGTLRGRRIVVTAA